MTDWAKVQVACDRFPKPPSFQPSYGTAGFRAEGSLLHSTMFRCGVLMALRSRKTGGITGIVVTASHNPAQDNGVKLVEPTGYMLTQDWEVHADRLAVAESGAHACSAIQDVCRAEAIQDGRVAEVWIGFDTRPSCGELVEAARQGVEAVGGVAEVRGLLTTPQLHWMVRKHNLGLPSGEGDYYTTLGRAFGQLTEGLPHVRGALVVDCANGVGAGKLQQMQPHLPGLKLELRNTGSGMLNGGCGADYVQKGDSGAPCLPNDFQGVESTARCVSIDGDADRVVFFTHVVGTFTLLDGDRIAVLAALLLNTLAAQLVSKQPVSVGIVQTAYANGSSTRYMREALGLQVLLAKTGVKHLHHLAETFDIGIYFEANGHGTVLFKDSLLERLRKEAGSCRAAADMLHVADMVNQAVGDAISGILLVEVALQRQGWSLQEWAALYQDLPSCMLKVKVPDRSLFTTTDAETRLVTPTGLQAEIDSLISTYQQGRSFVRPSGTEDVVRVYAEAQTQEAAASLAQKVADLVERSGGS